MRLGAVDIVADSPALGARTVIPEIDYHTPPYVFTDFDHFRRFLKGDYMRLLFEELSIKAGIVVLNTEWCQATSGIDPFATRRIDPPRVVGLRFGRHLLGFPDQARASFFKKPVTLSTDHHYRAVVQ